MTLNFNSKSKNIFKCKKEKKKSFTKPRLSLCLSRYNQQPVLWLEQMKFLMFFFTRSYWKSYFFYEKETLVYRIYTNVQIETHIRHTNKGFFYQKLFCVNVNRCLVSLHCFEIQLYFGVGVVILYKHFFLSIVSFREDGLKFNLLKVSEKISDGISELKRNSKIDVSSHRSLIWRIFKRNHWSDNEVWWGYLQRKK